MAKIDLSSVVTGYRSKEALDVNFQAIEDELNNKVLYRDNPDGEPNQMQNDLDMNGFKIINELATTGEGFIWEGAWITDTLYEINNLVSNNGSAYICTTQHTSGAFATDLAAGKWEVVAAKGADGGGSGDLVSTNNLSDVVSVSAARSNLGLGTAATKAFLDEDDMASNSDTSVPSQQSVKAYTDTKDIATQVVPGTSGNVLTSNGSTWISAAPSGASPINIQEFTISGTWTKPASGTIALIKVWAGGGGGAKYTLGAGGGGGGGYSEKWVLLSALGATETVTVGTGGAGATTNNGAGSDGVNSSFGSHLTAYGGGGAPIPATNQNKGGNGGGPTTAFRDGGTASTNGSGNAGIWWGGGGGSANIPNGTGEAGGGSLYGGGGGASGYVNSLASGGTSVFGGNGGASQYTSSGTNGTVPGGGGGATHSGTKAGDGAAGKVQVFVF